jgi:hypothetical protein
MVRTQGSELRRLMVRASFADRRATRGITMTMAIVLTLGAGALGQPTGSGPAPVKPAGSSPKAVPDPTPDDTSELVQMIRVVGEPTNVDELLDALETADQDIASFQAQIRYDRQFLLQGDRHVRYGELFFRVEPGKGGAGGAGGTGGAADAAARVRRTFSINFKTLYIDDAVRDDPSTWAFDGEFLIEKRPEDKTFIRRRIATPESPVDPLGLGESPIPFPIGQRKAAILQRYDAKMLPASDGLEMSAQDAKEDPEGAKEAKALIAAVSQTYQLRLTPRADYADQDEFKEVRLWYAKDKFVPRMARAVNRQGDVSVVQLINVKLNQPLPAGAISTAAPTEPGWTIQQDDRTSKGAGE